MSSESKVCIVFVCSLFLSLFKAIYYLLMTILYGFVGCYANLAMVNSSWTQSHIQKLWRISDRIVRIYPPCDTRTLQVCHSCSLLFDWFVFLALLKVL